MLARSFAGLITGVCWLLWTSAAHAQCTKDTDCKGNRVCEGGACVTAPAAAAPVAAPAAAAPQPNPAAAAAATGPTPVPRERYSTGMMAGGIVLTSFVPIALLVSLVANAEQTNCELYEYGNGSVLDGYYHDCDDYDATIYGGLVAAVALAGVGIPLIVIGGKKVPVPTASVRPWATAHSGGIGLRLDL